MPRQYKKEKPYIQVFCEGESEQAYTDFLKKTFEDVAVIRRCNSTGLFEEAESIYKKDLKYKNRVSATDEIWFFYDVEIKDIDKWDSRYKIIKQLRKMRKNQNIKVRLLMTTACIEYWLMLHFEKISPQLQTEADKEKMKRRLIRHESTYVKGDYDSTAKIAEKYLQAATNAKSILENLPGMPTSEDTDERNQWLSKHCPTFSTVYEAINFLEGNRKNQ